MGIVAAFIYVMVLIGCMVAQIDVNITLATLIGGFILVQQGLDVSQWAFKRHTNIEYQRAKRSGPPAVEVTAETATVTTENTAIETSAPVAPGSDDGQLRRDD